MPLRRLRLPFVLSLLLALAALSAPASAINMITNDATPAAAFDKALGLIDQKRYDDAIALLEDVAKEEPNSADVWTLLGFAYRSTGKTEPAFAAYNKALLLDPDHVGANEYLGELYLQVGDLAKAKAQLRILETTCVVGCPEAQTLQDSIEAYEAKQ